MATITCIQRCLMLPENERGRDLVVGDLHGHRSLFERELDKLGFDPALDRVLSVGDLIDRGPESLATLALIEQPWFHAVLGNHELMLLNYLGFYSSRVHSRRAYDHGSGAWILDALQSERKRLTRLAEQVALLPLAIHVSANTPFNVTHSDLRPLGSKQQRLFSGGSLDIHEADIVTSSRINIAEAMRSDLLGLTFANNDVLLSGTPLSALPLTYVGHSPVPEVTVHKSHVYIDQRVCARSGKHATARPPTVLEHRTFARWLRAATDGWSIQEAAAVVSLRPVHDHEPELT